MLEALDIDGKDLQLIRNLYWEQSAAIRIDGEISEWTSVKRGVRQGCVLSPALFNLYSEIILKEIKNMPGVKVGGININNLRYADDTVLIAETETDLQNILKKVVTESEKKGLQINIKKTECMVISKKNITPKCSLNIKGEEIKNVEKFTYLGSLITSDGRSVTEIKKRIGMAKEVFNKMSAVFKNRQLKVKTKVRVLECYVWSVLLYGCDAWTVNENMKERLKSVEMWFLRRMLRISWTERVTNEEVLRRAGVKRTLMKVIRKRQMQFLGHVMRCKGLENLVLTGKIEGKRSRGRQRQKFITSLNKDLNMGRSDLELLKLSTDRTGWKTMIANALKGQGT